MSCHDCVFGNKPTTTQVAIPCNTCLSDPGDKGYCLASPSSHGYVPIVTKLFNRNQALDIVSRAGNNGTELVLLQWSQERGAYQNACI